MKLDIDQIITNAITTIAEGMIVNASTVQRDLDKHLSDSFDNLIRLATAAKRAAATKDFEI